MLVIDKPYQKEFTTIFNRPILKSDKGRYYVLEYDVEELDRYFENYFAVNCQIFKVTIDYPEDMTTPIVYDVDLENDEVQRYKIFYYHSNLNGSKIWCNLIVSRLLLNICDINLTIISLFVIVLLPMQRISSNKIHIIVTSIS
jgi:hypothetical protein